MQAHFTLRISSDGKILTTCSSAMGMTEWWKVSCFFPSLEVQLRIIKATAKIASVKFRYCGCVHITYTDVTKQKKGVL